MITSYQRNQRRKNILLIVISAIFMVLGTVIWIADGHPIGPICVLFFGACLLAGVMELVGTESAKGQVLAIIGAFAFAAACACVVLASAAGVEITTRTGSATLMTIVSVIGVVFFGGGGVALLFRYLRRHRYR